MPELTLFNAAGRDAQVSAESVRIPVRIRRLDRDGKQCQSIRILRGTLSSQQSAVSSQQLIDGDPEIDIETVGMFLRPGESKRVYVDAAVNHLEIVTKPDGSETTRPAALRSANVHLPLAWSGKLISRQEAISKYVFSGKRQIRHVNGLTYDFLFDIAQELDKANSMLLVGAGPKANQPLVLRRGSLPYRGFLEGRVRDQEYLLLLHLSNLELKAPVALSSQQSAAAQERQVA
jgi:hypothetical protein